MLRPQLRRQVTLAATIALLAAPAGAAGDERADFTVGFAAHGPGAPTAMTLHIRYKAPGDPDAKPSPVRHVVIELPEGTQFLGGATCEATDDEFQQRGRDACPADSKVGTGAITVMTGVPPMDPFPTDATLFRGPAQLIELISRQGGNETLAVERLMIEGTRLSADVAQVPGGPPDGETAARDVDWSVPPGYLVTPPACPASGAWTSRGEFAFKDGAQASATSTTPCTAPSPAPAAAAARPARLTVSPTRVRAGAPVRLTVTLAASPRCRRGALVRIAGRRARTDAAGRAVLRVRLAKPGRHRLLAGAARCPRRTGYVTAS